MVPSEMRNTPAMRSAYTLLTWSITARPKLTISVLSAGSAITCVVAMIPPARAADTKTIARKSRPLPIRTEENS